MIWNRLQTNFFPEVTNCDYWINKRFGRPSLFKKKKKTNKLRFCVYRLESFGGNLSSIVLVNVPLLPQRQYFTYCISVIFNHLSPDLSFPNTFHQFIFQTVLRFWFSLFPLTWTQITCFQRSKLKGEYEYVRRLVNGRENEIEMGRCSGCAWSRSRVPCLELSREPCTEVRSSEQPTGHSHGD